MADFAGTSLSSDGGLESGAVLFMQDPARRSARLETPSGALASTRKGSTGLVVVIPAKTSATAALEEALDEAQIALDIWALKGIMARTLGNVEERHIAWWLDQTGPAARIWTEGYLAVESEIRVEVRDRHGNPVPPQRQLPPGWHPSFRFFRLGQTATDLVESFRNHYLAVESLLSTIEPIRVRVNGRPAEKEFEWLRRALTAAGHLVNLHSYVNNAASPDPVSDIIDDIYRGARTQTFHAKSGAPVLLPHDDVTRAAVRGSLHRLRRLYIDLVSHQFGMAPRGGTRIAPAVFRAMAEAVGAGPAYVSAEPMDRVAIEAGHVPADAVTMAARVDENLRRDYFSAVVAHYDVRAMPRRKVQQVGLLHNGVVGMYEDLDGMLDLTGFEGLQLVVAIRGQDPKDLGIRFKS